MKSVLVLIVLFALAAVLAACGSEGEGGSFLPSPEATSEGVNGPQIGEAEGLIQTDEGAVRYDAIDNNPAADPAEREAAYFEVAGKLIADFLTDPNQDLYYELIWEEPIEGNARIRVTGFFQEGGQWVEKYADFRITRTPAGNWILKDEVVFGFTSDEERRQADKQVVEKYTRILGWFEKVSAEVVSVEETYEDDSSLSRWVLREFKVSFENQNDEDHTLNYLVGWEDVSDKSYCSGTSTETGEVTVKAQSTVSVEVNDSRLDCPGLSLGKVWVSVRAIDGYLRKQAERMLESFESETSPP